jgi:hypothetical protein
MFISRIMDNLYEGRFYQRPEIEHAEDIANQVLKLKEKLGEPLDEGATGVILCYAELKEKRKRIYGIERANFAKQQLSKLGVENIEEAKLSRRSKSDDRISQPSKGRFFPFNTTEVTRLLNELNFKHSEYSSRVDLSFINPDDVSEYGIKVAAFYPSDELIIFSFPESFPQSRSKALVVAALQAFSRIDKEVTPTWNRQKSTSYRTYLSELNRLVLTRRERAIKQAKYRSTDKFSSRCSPKGIRTAEVVLKELEVK